MALFVLGTYFSFANPAFLTRSNILVILLQISVLGIVAVPGAMLLLAGKIDLSVGSVAGLVPRVSDSSTRYLVGRSAFLLLGALAVGGLVGAHERCPGRVT